MLIEWYLWGNLPNFFEEDNEWEVIYEDNCDKWDCAFKICFERKKKEVAKDN